jgi:hypothetical protein
MLKDLEDRGLGTCTVRDAGGLPSVTFTAGVGVGWADGMTRHPSTT